MFFLNQIKKSSTDLFNQGVRIVALLNNFLVFLQINISFMNMNINFCVVNVDAVINVVNITINFL